MQKIFSSHIKILWVLILCHTLIISTVQASNELEKTLALIEQSYAIDLSVLGPILETRLEDKLKPSERSKLLKILINVYFADGYQQKFKQLAQKLKQHGKLTNSTNDVYIAELFLLADTLHIELMSQELYQALLDKKAALNAGQLDEKRLQLDLMLTSMSPESFTFSQEQTLINHLAKIHETDNDTLYEFFIYKTLAVSTSQIDQMLHYSQKLLHYAETNNLPVNRSSILHNIGYWYHFRRMTDKARLCVDLQNKIAQQTNGPKELFFAQVREVEQLDQEQNYSAMSELIAEMKAKDNIPAGFWQNFIDYYEAIALAYSGQTDEAEQTYERLYDFLTSDELSHYALPKYLKAHIAFNQHNYELSKQVFNDYWWHRYNHVVQTQDNQVNAVRTELQQVVNEKDDSIQLAEHRLSLFKWATALLLLLFIVIILLIAKVLKNTRALAQHRDQLRILNRTDDLTQMYNRRYLQKRLLEEFDLLKRNNRADSVLVMIDIDKFKQINDTHGHLAGDVVIQVIAEMVQERLRSTDICGRLGGEEFLVLLRNTTAENAYLLAEQLRINIENKIINYHDQSITTTCSVGIAAFSNDMLSCHDWIQQADDAMYQSKSKGRNQTTMYKTS